MMLLIFLIIVYRKGRAHDKSFHAVKKDFISIYDDMKQIILSNRKAIKFIIVGIVAINVAKTMPLKTETLYIIDDALSAIIGVSLILIFTPREDSSRTGFPIEIFGFIFSVIFMFYCAGNLVFDLFYENDFFKEDMWMFGYSVTILSYVACIASLRGFMERNLSKEEIVLLGLIMMITLEFITYYGIGFFSGMKWYDPADYETDIFGNITNVINQGIYVASQSQILERTPMEVWGNIVLNGTDALTITAVLGYMAQKFIEKA